MLPTARVSAKTDHPADDTLRDLTALFQTGRAILTHETPPKG
jgi:hypothetical protein